MNIKAKLILSIAVCVAALTPAEAVYIGGSIGYLMDNEEEMLILNAGAAFAKSETVTHNAEFEVGYVEYSEELGGIDFTAFMINYLMKSKPEKGLGFYGGVGIGITYYDLQHIDNEIYLGYSGNVMAFQLLGGIQYALNPATSIKFGYRYLSLEEIDVDGTMVSMDDNLLEIGITFHF